MAGYGTNGYGAGEYGDPFIPVSASTGSTGATSGSGTRVRHTSITIGNSANLTGSAIRNVGLIGGSAAVTASEGGVIRARGVGVTADNSALTDVFASRIISYAGSVNSDGNLAGKSIRSIYRSGSVASAGVSSATGIRARNTSLSGVATSGLSGTAGNIYGISVATDTDSEISAVLTPILSFGGSVQSAGNLTGFHIVEQPDDVIHQTFTVGKYNISTEQDGTWHESEVSGDFTMSDQAIGVYQVSEHILGLEIDDEYIGIFKFEEEPDGSFRLEENITSIVLENDA